MLQTSTSQIVQVVSILLVPMILCWGARTQCRVCQLQCAAVNRKVDRNQVNILGIDFIPVERRQWSTELELGILVLPHQAYSTSQAYATVQQHHT
jgi:hypothetical protein